MVYRLIGPDGESYDSASPGRFGGNRRSRVYGLLVCPSATRALKRGTYQKNRVFFADEETAQAAGYRPCGSCINKRMRLR